MPPIKTRSAYRQQDCQFDEKKQCQNTIKQSKRCKRQNLEKFVPQKNTLRLKKIEKDIQTGEQDDWRDQFTKDIYKDQNVNKKSEKIKQIGSKYPKQKLNTKQKSIRIIKKNKNSSSKYQNLCPICLDIHSQTQGIIKCGHKFCFQCIQEWTKSSTNCPCCRNIFTDIIQITTNDQNIQIDRQLIKVQHRSFQLNDLDYLICLQCNDGRDQDLLLICDICDFYCCHVYCDESLDDIFPSDQWYCKFCKQSFIVNLQIQSTNLPERTQTLIQRSQKDQSQSSSQSDSQINNNQTQSKNFIKNKEKRKSINNASKTEQFFQNYSHISPKDRLNSVINRITNNIPRNLRNLRRREY